MEGCFKFQWVLEVGGFRWGGPSFLVEEYPPLGGIGFDMGGGRWVQKICRMGTVLDHSSYHDTNSSSAGLMYPTSLLGSLSPSGQT